MGTRKGLFQPDRDCAGMKKKPSSHAPSVFAVQHAGYPYAVVIAIAVTDERLRRELEATGATLSAEDVDSLKFTDHEGGRASLLDDGTAVIRLRSWAATPRAFGILAHELFHAVEMLFDFLKMRLSDDSAEAYAYAIGHVTEKVIAELAKSPARREKVAALDEATRWMD